MTEWFLRAAERLALTEGVSVWARETESLCYDYEPSVGAGTETRAHRVLAEVRFLRDGRMSAARGSVGSVGDLERLFSDAQDGANLGAPVGPRPGQVERRARRPSAEKGEVSSVPARVALENLLNSLGSPLPCIQALLARQEIRTVSVWGQGPLLQETSSMCRALIRVETALGAIVDGVCWDLFTEPDLRHLGERLATSVRQAKNADVRPTWNRRLPVVLGPSVAAAFISGLAWALRGDIAASSPTLKKSRGRRIFPAGLTVVDSPVSGPELAHRTFDDEGIPIDECTLIRDGVFERCLHTRATAFLAGDAPNGRGFVDDEAGLIPAPTGFRLREWPWPTAAAHIELDTRFENFTSMPRPGVVSAVVAGWEIADGTKRRIGPLELEVPVLQAFRRLIGVGADSRWSPAAEFALVPTLVFDSL